ncbi:alpha/beta hydrolase [Caballeronia hypogeia]|uniref:Alpha/beta hydrolase n=1 Tax=Caballeronia hypogeia TaxID=1777140 RepID=A0A158C0G7_9BURK|nr:alpha/beta fold hydrolase [Caballeronia hypogeia]SAK75813.1 alpha/beta hydrolase [Caballeronia hypogeia]
MSPIVFGGRFGWLHSGAGVHGVVVCNSFGHENTWAHQAIRHLAEALSRRDIPVLRFDYLTTGDSADNLEGNRLDGLVADVTAAIDCLRSETGVTTITLAGLRLGGALASLASPHPPVDSLALLAPVTNGRLYLRELTALRKAWIENLPEHMRARQHDAPFNVLGQVYGDAFLDDLRELDVASTVCRSASRLKRAFIADIRAGASEPLCAALRNRGVEVETKAFVDYFDFMQETATSVLPGKTLTRTVQWIADNVAESIPIDPASGTTKAAARSRSGGDAIIETPGAIEHPVVIGSAGLFGVLCEPRDERAGGPVVVITNTALSVHHGDSRQSVHIARELARRGVASLRIDARGIGDSPHRPADEAHHPITMSIHAQSISEDAASAAAWLKRKGYDTVITFGVCSGAYSALRASLVEPAIAAVIAVNLQRFYIPESITLTELRREMSHTMRRLGPAILAPGKWWLVLSGKRGLRPIVRAFASNAMARLNSQLGILTRGSLCGVGEKPLTHPRGVVQALERKGVHALLLYSVNDDGLDQLNAHFGRHGKKLSQLRRVRPEVCRGVDHSLGDTGALARVIALCDNFIKNLS